jgi:hypothetical protein
MAFAVAELVVLVVLAVLIIVGAAFGWERYRGSHAGGPAGGAARPTAEVFIDPDTGQRMRVWFDDRTGQREYRPE